MLSSHPPLSPIPQGRPLLAQFSDDLVGKKMKTPSSSQMTLSSLSWTGSVFKKPTPDTLCPPPPSIFLVFCNHDLISTLPLQATLHTAATTTPPFFFFFFFLGLYPQHMEVLRPGVRVELPLPTYTTAHSNARSTTHWTSPGIKPASSWILVRFISTAPQGKLQQCF